jgi:hypothetical protein
MESFIKTNQLYKNNKIEPLKYFKEQDRKIRVLDDKDELPVEYLLSDDFKFFIESAYNYVIQTNYKMIPIKFYRSYYEIQKYDELQRMLFFIFCAQYMSLYDLLIINESDYYKKIKEQRKEKIINFLKNIFSSTELSNIYFNFLFLNLTSVKPWNVNDYSGKALFKRNIENFVMIKDYVTASSSSVYNRFLIKILRKFPDAFTEEFSEFINSSGLTLNEECANIFYDSGDNEVFKIYDEEKNITYCLDEEEKEEYLRTNHNPYDRDTVAYHGDAPRNIYLNKQLPEDVELDDILYYWTDQIYTKNRVFVGFTNDQISRLKVTVPETNITLYRGMKYECNEESIIAAQDTRPARCRIKFDTYSSWSYSQKIAKRFAGDTGVLLKYTFTPEQIVVDLTKIKNRRTDNEHELEIIVYPGTYECETIKDFDSETSRIDKCEISKIDKNIKKIKIILRKLETNEKIKKLSTATRPFKVNEFIEILNLLNKGDKLTVDKLKTPTQGVIKNYPDENIIVCEIIDTLESLLENSNYHGIFIYINDKVKHAHRE